MARIGKFDTNWTIDPNNDANVIPALYSPSINQAYALSSSGNTLVISSNFGLKTVYKNNSGWEYYTTYDLGVFLNVFCVTDNLIIGFSVADKNLVIFEDQLDGTYSSLDTVAMDPSATFPRTISCSSDGSVVALSYNYNVVPGTGTMNTCRTVIHRRSGNAWPEEKVIENHDKDIYPSFYAGQSKLSPDGDRLIVWIAEPVTDNVNLERYEIDVYAYNGVDDWTIINTLPASGYKELTSHFDRESEGFFLGREVTSTADHINAVAVSNDASVVCVNYRREIDGIFDRTVHPVAVHERNDDYEPQGVLVFRETTPNTWELIQNIRNPMPQYFRTPDAYDALGPRAGCAVSMSSNGNRIAISFNSEHYTDSSQQSRVFIYDYNSVAGSYDFIQDINPTGEGNDWGQRHFLSSNGEQLILPTKDMVAAPVSSEFNVGHYMYTNRASAAGTFEIITLPAIGSWAQKSLPRSPLLPQSLDSDTISPMPDKPEIYSDTSYFSYYSGFDDARPGKNNVIAYQNGTGSGSTASCAFSEIVKYTGKHYIEFEYRESEAAAGSGDFRVGIALARFLTFGSGIPRFSIFNFGNDTSGRDYAFLQSGFKRSNNSSTATDSGAVSSGQTVGIAVDFDDRKIWFSVDGTWVDGGDPVSGTNEAFTLSVFASTLPWVACVGNLEGNGNIQPTCLIMKVNDTEYNYTRPVGFDEWDSTVNTNSDWAYPAIAKHYNPVSYWKFDSAVANVVSDDIGSNNITFEKIDDPSPLVDPITPGVGHNACAYFNVDVTNARGRFATPITINPNTPFTISFAVWPEGRNTAKNILLSSGTDANRFELYYESVTTSDPEETPNIVLETEAPGDAQVQLSITDDADTVYTRAWNSILLSGDGQGNISLYVNGGLSGTTTFSGTNEDYNIRLIAHSDLYPTTNYMDGFIDELAYYDTDITGGQPFDFNYRVNASTTGLVCLPAVVKADMVNPVVLDPSFGAPEVYRPAFLDPATSPS